MNIEWIYGYEEYVGMAIGGAIYLVALYIHRLQHKVKEDELIIVQ